MVRTNKPYQRPDTYRKSNPDATGSWKHDLHDSVRSSLASRISSSSSSSTTPASRSSLLNRITGGQGKELLPSNSSNVKLHGFDGPPPANLNNPNAGVELLPSGNGRRPKNSGRGVNNQSKDQLNAALGVGAQRVRDVRPVQRELIQPQQQVSIMGAARGTTWVRVENLALGTTAEDVESAFAPLAILNSKTIISATPNTVTVDLELENRSDAEGLIKQYHGVVADGNTLSVTIINQGLKGRIGASTPAVVQQPAQPAERKHNVGRELLGSNSSGKLYSDTILAANPTSSIMTLSDGSAFTPTPEAAAAARRSDAWRQGGPSLAQRLGGPRSKGRGQIGGGSFHDMLID
ncbi:hypothetical protein I302_107899 [Kwoniella bestiolae CBS 10118]|uniref:RRM domain-containing protein n=1 Tax=Kwoniella bestiolae CBS 10118 TaxID=1296100 RepID=A0A1B9FX76_9TREE|nr:hypothetical protein I302_06359 [Kwoniella bestiolae CBS 10118]OCF23378.1 hypothetical protein I302_06359 [Kwoniella bestiolae CBS 10118]